MSNIKIFATQGQINMTDYTDQNATRMDQKLFAQLPKKS